MYSLYFVGIREFNKLNVPTHDRRHQVKAKEVICQAAELVHELVSGMSNFHTYTEQVSNDIFVSNEVLFFVSFMVNFQSIGNVMIFSKACQTIACTTCQKDI